MRKPKRNCFDVPSSLSTLSRSFNVVVTSRFRLLTYAFFFIIIFICHSYAVYSCSSDPSCSKGGYHCSFELNSFWLCLCDAGMVIYPHRPIFERVGPDSIIYSAIALPWYWSHWNLLAFFQRSVLRGGVELLYAENGWFRTVAICAGYEQNNLVAPANKDKTLLYITR